MDIIESGLFNSEMTHPEYEIHHRRDDLLDYRPKEAAEAIKLHYHEFYEVYFFISGNVTYLVENKTYHLSAGDILFMSPMELHQPLFTKSQGIYERIVLWIEPNKLAALSSGEVSFFDCFRQSWDSTDAHLYHVKGGTFSEIQKILDDLARTSRKKDAYEKMTADALLTLLLLRFHKLTGRASAASDKRRMSVAVANCVDYINLHLADDLSLDVLSKECFISKQHLLRTFKEAMGFSVHQYIQKKRLLAAKTQMLQGASPKESAERCGFSDYSVFYRAYRKEYQKSPTQ